MKITTMGMDLVETVVAIHGVKAHGKAAVKKLCKRLQRRTSFSSHKPCLIALEACGCAHIWGLKTRGARTHGEAHDPAPREALRQNPQERCRRCRRDPGHGLASQYAPRAHQERRKPCAPRGPPRPPSVCEGAQRLRPIGSTDCPRSSVPKGP